MTKDEIIKLARETGIDVICTTWAQRHACSAKAATA